MSRWSATSRPRKPKPAPAAATRVRSTPDALLLVGHGSARHPDAADGLQAHAEALRQSGAVARIAVGLLNGVPTVADAVRALANQGMSSADRTASIGTVHVVPFFMEDGYFSRVAVPRAVNAATAGQQLRFCPPVGVHQDIAALIEQRILASCATAAVRPGNLSIVLVAHGSARAPGRIMAAHAHATRLTEARQFAQVQVAFLEETPFVSDSLADLRDRPVAVIGLFATEGRHARDDLPSMIEAENARRPNQLMDLGFIGDDPAMPRIILTQAGFAPAGSPSVRFATTAPRQKPPPSPYDQNR